ncbi:hypothetical protein D6D28_00798 [Aureobasidium pullulans]|uniref:Xylanolytic transcriptional activator regulatory domain-containing protein n=1 Tax=Aureobasidium pullulans TaxID=5580 RepID=A0A4S8T052_AURPU|nr:hypothetical protein D6D28_00798 [Aureobasidium pullulans]
MFSVRTRATDKEAEQQEDTLRRESLLNNAWRERAFEEFSSTPEPYRYLLDSHWSWIQPLFNFVYRPAFTRDMKTGGQYYSAALFNAILSHSVRWCKTEPGMEKLLAPFNEGSSFFQTAVTNVFVNLRTGRSKIPSVQSLLLLSAQECGRGNRTQAWLYSGMAFRLIDDMGMCIDGQRYTDSAKLSAEDIEIRNRLFWSCFFWDKLIALYFGRAPVLQKSHISPPRVIMDDTAETELWMPHGLSSPDYPPRQAHSISCFVQMCGLAEILNQVLIQFYGPTCDLSSPKALACALEQSSKMRVWWRDLPEHLKITVGALPRQAPPSHIVTLNCLYHTVNILLHRTLLRLSSSNRAPSDINIDQNPLIQCISSAASIIALFGLFVRTFGDGHVVLSLAYSLYTATSILLLELQANPRNPQRYTMERLSYCLSALERVKKTNPVIATASELIHKELEALGLDIHAYTTLPNATGDRTGQSLHQPTFVPLSTGSQSSAQKTSSVPDHRNFVFMDACYLDNDDLTGGMDYDILDMSPSAFEAFTQIEPLSTTMNPGFDFF